jgi:hypothetical protein
MGVMVMSVMVMMAMRNLMVVTMPAFVMVLMSWHFPHILP